MEKKNNRNSINTTMMIISIIVVLFLIPLVFIKGNLIKEFLVSIGVKNSPDLYDGNLIAEFYDPSGDLLLSLPDDTLYKDARNSLDIRKFAVKKVKISPLAGSGLDARLNLCFEFDGKQSNPFEFKHGFSFPVLHVYIKAPDTTSLQGTSNKTANVSFDHDRWNYQVIIDGMHEQARVYDCNGKFLFNGLGIYVNCDYEKKQKGKEKKIKKTKITAGLPMDSIGDPSAGEWKYYVVVGLLDVRDPSLLYRSGRNSSNVFDYVASDTSSRSLADSSGFLSLPPLIVNDSRSQK